MRIKGFAHYALMGALAVSLGCARNTEDTDDNTATGRASTADTTTATTADTAGRGAGVVGATADTFNVSPIDSVRTGVVEVNPRHGDSTAARTGADTAGTDSLRIHRDSANVDPAAGWPSDSTRGGWSTNPADSL
jgi:hypothetical protein